jgi:hypothetical protein
MSDLTDWWDECKQRGVALVEAGDVLPESQPDYFDVQIVRMEETQLSEFRGGCSRCSESEVIDRTNCHGVTRQLCKWTFKPCQRQRLASILDLYGRAFQ